MSVINCDYYLTEYHTVVVITGFIATVLKIMVLKLITN